MGFFDDVKEVINDSRKLDNAHLAMETSGHTEYATKKITINTSAVANVGVTANKPYVINFPFKKISFIEIMNGTTYNPRLQEGGERVNKAYVIGATDASPSSTVCGTFNFSDTSKKTLRLMREQSIVGTPSFHYLYADRSSTNGQRDIKVTVRPLTRMGNCIKF